ncbi:MAG: hypothetical protein ACPG30_08445 [Parvibaculales bacterium]
MRILFIDDDVVFSNALSEMLEEQIIRSIRPKAAKAALNWPIFTIIRPLFWISACRI